MLLYAEAGVEFLIPYAKRKLAYFKQLLGDAGVTSFHRRVDVDNGSVIYIDSIALGHGQYNDRIRVTGTSSNIWFGQFMLGLEVNITGDLAISFFGVATGTNTAVITIAGPGGVHSFIGTAIGSGANSVTYSRYPVNFALGRTMRPLRPGIDQIVSGAATLLIQDSPEAVSAAGLDFSLGAFSTTWPAYLAALTGGNVDFPFIPNPGYQENILNGVLVPFSQGVALYPPINTTIPVPSYVLNVTLFSPTGNGNVFGIFGNPAASTGTQVLGTASFRFDSITMTFSFISWKPTTGGLISVALPANLGGSSSSNGMGANALFRWVPSPVENKSLTTADKTFAAAVLAATRQYPSTVQTAIL